MKMKTVEMIFKRRILMMMMLHCGLKVGIFFPLQQENENNVSILWNQFKGKCVFFQRKTIQIIGLSPFEALRVDREHILEKEKGFNFPFFQK